MMQRQKLPTYKSIQEYGDMRANIDVTVFESAAREIIQRHKLPDAPLKLFPDGSNVIFAHGLKRMIKIFPALLENQFQSEALVLKHLQQKLIVPTPVLEYTGNFESWPYLIMSRVKGETLESIWGDLDFENKSSLIREIGALIKEVHLLGTQGLEAIDCHWPQFVDQQKSHCVDRHRKNKLKEQILSELPGYLKRAGKLLPLSVIPVLLTGEYTPFNLLVEKISNRWTLSGMIDFGDCMLGYHEYDLLGPGAFLIQGNRQLLREFLLGYGYSENELTPDLSRRLTLLMLLHRFSNLRIQIRIPDWEERVSSPGDLEKLVWGFVNEDYELL